MWMNKDEIARSYRMARDKRHQITILSELNLVPISEIKAILIEMGEIKEKKPKHSAREDLNTQICESVEKGSAGEPTTESQIVENTKAEPKKRGRKKREDSMKKIPESIAKLAFEKLDEIEQRISVYEQEMKKLEAEYKEISDFLEVTKC